MGQNGQGYLPPDMCKRRRTNSTNSAAAIAACEDESDEICVCKSEAAAQSCQSGSRSWFCFLGVRNSKPQLVQSAQWNTVYVTTLQLGNFEGSDARLFLPRMRRLIRCWGVTWPSNANAAAWFSWCFGGSGSVPRHQLMDPKAWANPDVQGEPASFVCQISLSHWSDSKYVLIYIYIIWHSTVSCVIRFLASILHYNYSDTFICILLAKDVGWGVMPWW